MTTIEREQAMRLNPWIAETPNATLGNVSDGIRHWMQALDREGPGEDSPVGAGLWSVGLALSAALDYERASLRAGGA